jgi:hypothetical protein
VKSALGIAIGHTFDRHDFPFALGSPQTTSEGIATFRKNREGRKNREAAAGRALQQRYRHLSGAASR